MLLYLVCFFDATTDRLCEMRPKLGHISYVGFRPIFGRMTDSADANVDVPGTHIYIFYILYCRLSLNFQ